MNRKELINKYIEFFKSKNHKEIPNSPLVPKDDPTVLFTTAGMHPLVPYLLGQPHPLGKRLVNNQKCIRTGDIDEVGDTTHHTFFEMLGNWSVGDYFKEEAIKWSFEFLTKVLKIPIERLAVTVFGGDKDFPQIPKDGESAKIWEALKIKKERIAFMKGGVANSADNWWGPAGQTGPCGSSTEMFYWKNNSNPTPKKFNPNDENWVEIWNDVLMQYVKDKSGKYNLAKQQNVDTGMGLERTLAVLNNFDDNYLTEIWQPIIKQIEKISGKKYSSDQQNKNVSTNKKSVSEASLWAGGRELNKHEIQKAMRIIADHLKASCFIIADGVIPGNSEQGYVLRRLIRRAIRYGKGLGMENFTSRVAEPIFKIYEDYPELQKNKGKILDELEQEENRFNLTLEKGLNKFNKIKGNIDGKTAFLLFQSFGFPIEITIELAKEKKIKVDEKGFQKEFTKHQELSRTASEGMFKSGLADNSEATTKLHTVAHLLLSAIRFILKDDTISQKGSNITPERLRLDFNYHRKLTPEELTQIEDLVNAEIQKSSEVIREEMSPKKALKQGALGSFGHKYGECVSVYSVGGFSKEICAGPHVTNTNELGHFKIQKEESSSAGVRRIKAVLE